jgi:hypothetical protein
VNMTSNMVRLSGKCIACNAPVRRIAFGVVAPWIIDLSKGGGITAKKLTSLVACTICEFTFYENRFSDDEMSAMYSCYREEEYFKVRNSWEPWYRRAVNNAYVDESGHLDERVGFMTSLLISSGIKRCETVVDFGGDEGQFFPEISIENRIVIDLSNKPLRKNVLRVPSLDEVKNRIDLIVAAHIAEHVNDPLDFFFELISHLNPGAHLYVEVPMDCPSVTNFHATESYEAYLKRVCSRGKRLFIALDFISGFARQFGFRIPKRGIVKQSEHLNYYNLKSITIILERLGMTVLKSEAVPGAKVGGLRLGRLGVLAVKN